MKTFQASTITRSLFEEALTFFPVRPLGAADAGQELAAHLGACWGVEDAASLDVIKVHASLAIALWERLIVHRLRPAAVEQIQSCNFVRLPAVAPRLLNGAWLLEVCHPERGERLFGDTFALGSFYEKELQMWALVGWRLQEGALYASLGFWSPSWEEGSLRKIYAGTYGIIPMGTNRIAGLTVAYLDQTEWNRAGDRWLLESILFALFSGDLLENAHGPLRIQDEGLPVRMPPARKSGTDGTKRKGVRTWITRNVFLNPAAPPGAALPEAHWSGHANDGLLVLPVQAPVDRPERDGAPDLHLAGVDVRGHQRRIFVGKGRSEMKWVAIQPHRSRRWVSTLPVRNVVR